MLQYMVRAPVCKHHTYTNMHIQVHLHYQYISFSMNKKSLQNTLLAVASGAIILGSLLAAGVASAQTPPTSGQGGGGAGGGRSGMNHTMPGVFGTVSTISGTTLTLSSKGFGGPQATDASASAKTYTVDASSATVFKDGATSTLSSVAVGDTVMAAGTVSGTSVTATTIRDGVVSGMGGKPGETQQGTSDMRGEGGHASSTPSVIQGNGEPVIGGTVSTVSGNALTVTTAQGNVTYSVDVSSAVIKKDNATSSVSNIAVGDKVVVQGTVNGNSVAASSVIDSVAGSAQASTTVSASSHSNGGIGKIFNSIGNFFHNLFGFF
jgi:hypothetical protein